MLGLASTLSSALEELGEGCWLALTLEDSSLFWFVIFSCWSEGQLQKIEAKISFGGAHDL